MTADNHLGRHYDRMFPQRLEERRGWLRRGFARAVQYAIEQRTHLFLQLGDLFDSPEPRNLERQFVAEQLAALRAAGVRCLAVSGNHDTPRSRNGQALATPQGVYASLGVLRLLGGRLGAGPPGGSAVDCEIVEIEGVRVAVGGMPPDPTAPAGHDPLEGLRWQPEADIVLLLVHASLEGHVHPAAPEAIIHRKSVEALRGVHCLLAGHVHRYAAFRWGDKVVVVPGATERMTFGELDGQPGFAYLELEPGRLLALRQVAVECQPRQHLLIATSELTGADPAGLLKAKLEKLCDRDTMVRVSLVGPISKQRYHELQLRAVAEYGASRCFFLDLDSSGLYVDDEMARLPAGVARLSQREELMRSCREAYQAAQTEEERALIEEATRAILDGYE